MSSGAVERPLTVALLGGGTVGAQVARLLVDNAHDLEERIGAPVELTSVLVRDTGRARDGIPADLVTDDANAVARSGADIVVEVMGGIEPARSLILQAMAAGSSIVTANKALLAVHGQRGSDAREREARARLRRIDAHAYGRERQRYFLFA